MSRLDDNVIVYNDNHENDENDENYDNDDDNDDDMRHKYQQTKYKLINVVCNFSSLILEIIIVGLLMRLYSEMDNDISMRRPMAIFAVFQVVTLSLIVSLSKKSPLWK